MLRATERPCGFLILAHVTGVHMEVSTVTAPETIVFGAV